MTNSLQGSESEGIVTLESVKPINNQKHRNIDKCKDK
jgi:hypothetical protein